MPCSPSTISRGQRCKHFSLLLVKASFLPLCSLRSSHTQLLPSVLLARTLLLNCGTFFSICIFLCDFKTPVPHTLPFFWLKLFGRADSNAGCKAVRFIRGACSSNYHPVLGLIYPIIKLTGKQYGGSATLVQRADGAQHRSGNKQPHFVLMHLDEAPIKRPAPPDRDAWMTLCRRRNSTRPGLAGMCLFISFSFTPV